MKRFNPIVMVLAGLTGALLLLAACGSAPTAAPNGGTPLPVVVDDFAVIAEGRIVPRQFAQLSFSGGGRVDRLLAAEGSSVAADSLIAQLELKGSDALAAQVASAQLEVLNAQQALSALTEAASLTTAQAAFGVAQAQDGVVQAQDAVTKAEKDLKLVQNPAGKGLTDSVADAKLALDTAQANLQLENASPEQQALYQAIARADQAFRIYQDLQAKLDENTGSLELQDATRQAQAAYQAAQDQVSTLRLTIDTAKANQSAAVTDAQERYDTAVANLAAAQRGPDAEKLTLAQAKVTLSQAKLTLAQATLADAQAQLAKVQSGPDATQAALAQARLEAAQASLAAAQAAITQTQEATELRAPFAGTLAALSIKQGEQAAPGQPVATLADFSAWAMETDNLTEIEVIKIQPGQGVTIVLDALPEVVLHG
ncbi:MAG: efflux RND transporter periplasmic adaptor subunit, partial [Anaerolineales bacterium]